MHLFAWASRVDSAKSVKKMLNGMKSSFESLWTVKVGQRPVVTLPSSGIPASESEKLLASAAR